jgi:hypothetical protein
MLCVMRVWLVILVGCSAPAHTISNTNSSPTPVRAPPCGYTDFGKLDRDAWEAANEETVDRRHGRASKPRPVGTCLLFAIDWERQRYVVREGSRDIAQLSRETTLLLVPGMGVGGFEVGTSSDKVLERHPADEFRIACGPTQLGTLCGFAPLGSELNSMFEFLVSGELPGAVGGTTAREFFRHKTLRGVGANLRLD